jgi:hypothetical protein
MGTPAESHGLTCLQVRCPPMTSEIRGQSSAALARGGDRRVDQRLQLARRPGAVETKSFPYGQMPTLKPARATRSGGPVSTRLSVWGVSRPTGSRRGDRCIDRPANRSRSLGRRWRRGARRRRAVLDRGQLLRIEIIRAPVGVRGCRCGHLVGRRRMRHVARLDGPLSGGGLRERGARCEPKDRKTNNEDVARHRVFLSSGDKSRLHPTNLRVQAGSVLGMSRVIHPGK